jgi:hypothetical protein
MTRSNVARLIIALALAPACSGTKNDKPLGLSPDGSTSAGADADPSASADADPSAGASMEASVPPEARAAASDPSSVELGEFEVLPAMAAMPSGTIEEQATALAAQIHLGGAHSLPALLTALRASGIGVRLADGTLAIAPDGPGQGYVVEAWEVQGLAAAESVGLRVPLSTIAAELRAALAELTHAPIEDDVLDSVRAATAAASPELRFWGTFIVRLGARPEDPVDLLGPDAAAALGPIQASLLLRRLAFELAASVKLRGVRSRASSASAPGSSHCQLTDTEQEVLDTNAVATQYLEGKLIDYLTSKGVSVVPDLSFANFALSYAKFFATLALFKVEMTLSGSPPLVRTKTRTAGEDRDLNAHVSFDPHSAQWVNCVRPALNVFGLDFDLPQAGPVAGAGVKWQLLDGTGHVQFHGDPVHGNLTNDAGDSKIVFQGKEQPRTVPETSQPYLLDARVHTSVILKPPAFFRDVRDAAGNASFTGLLTTPAEMAYRTEYLFGRSATFQVRDWRAPGWTAKFAFEVHGKQRTSTGGGIAGDSIRTESASYAELAAGELEGPAPPPVPGYPQGVPTVISGSILVAAEEAASFRLFGPQSCTGEGDIALSLNLSEMTARFAGPVAEVLTLQVADDGGWELGVILPVAELLGTSSTYSEQSLTGCRMDYSMTDSQQMPITSGTVVEMLPFHGQLDPGDPNHIVIDFPFSATTHVGAGSDILPLNGSLNIDLARR